MQTTATQRAAVARTPARSKPVYPQLPDTDHPGFWLAVFLREQAELDEVRKIQQSKGFYKKPEALQYAVHTSQRLMREQMKVSQGYLIEEGQLPFAHAHTTYFDQQVPA